MLLPVAGGRSTAVKFGEFIMILELHRQGLKVAAIARQLGIDRKTVRKYISQPAQAASSASSALPKDGQRLIKNHFGFIRLKELPSGLEINPCNRNGRNSHYTGFHNNSRSDQAILDRLCSKPPPEDSHGFRELI